MNNKDEDQILSDLYQQGNQEQPPKALDDLILKQAQQSQLATSKSKHSWRPWLAAASVVLVLPMIWLLTQQQQLSSELKPIQPPTSQAAETLNAAPKAEEAFAADADMEAEAMDHDQAEYGKITVTGSRLKAAPESPAAAPMVDYQDLIEQQGQRSITGKPIDQQSLQANKELLMDEFKAKKRTIKPSTMDPLMLLEYEQFGRYLDEGNIEAADQLLTEMQENWPDFDFEDMIYRLAEVEASSG
jgi:hypothetical protein